MMKWLKNNKFQKNAVYTAFFILFFLIYASYPTLYTQVRVETDICKISTDQFDLQWKHSVEKTAWSEQYQRQKNKFLLRHTDLISFGAGTPSNYPIEFQKNGVIRMRVNQNIDEINWVISRNMQGTILADQKIWSIFQSYPDYSLVNISVQYQPKWKSWWIGECL